VCWKTKVELEVVIVGSRSIYGSGEQDGIRLSGKETDCYWQDSGIGKEVASVVLRNGGSVMVVVRRDDKTKAATVELGLRGEVSGWTGDITNGASRADLIQDLNGKHADATMLVNAAGVFVPKSFLEHSEPTMTNIWSCNLGLTVNLILHLARPKLYIPGAGGGPNPKARSLLT